MSIEAMKLAIEAIKDLRGYRPDIDGAIEALRSALAQQPATGEPVAWKYQPQDGLKHPAFTEHEAIAIAHGKDGSVVPLCAHQAPSVPDDVARNAERYRWLREQHWHSSELCCVSKPKSNVRLGGFCPSGDLLDEAIDAAMLHNP